MQFRDRLRSWNDADDDGVTQRKLQRRGWQGDMVSRADRGDAADPLHDALRRWFGVEERALDGPGRQDAGIVRAADNDFRAAPLAQRQKRGEGFLLEQCIAAGKQEVVEM